MPFRRSSRVLAVLLLALVQIAMAHAATTKPVRVLLVHESGAFSPASLEFQQGLLHHLRQELGEDVELFSEQMETTRLPETQGKVLPWIRERYTAHGIDVVIYIGPATTDNTMHETEKIILDALEAGARGLVLKSDAGENMVAAVQSIAAGRRFFTSSVVDTVVDAYLAKRDSGRQDAGTLTSRENEVVQLLAEGKSNKEVAGILFITDRTVEGHRREIMRKLDLGSIADLVRYAVRNGIIQP